MTLAAVNELAACDTQGGPRRHHLRGALSLLTVIARLLLVVCCAHLQIGATLGMITMPVPDETAVPIAAKSARADRPGPLSRRSVLRTGAGAGAAALALTTLASSPALAASRARADASDDDLRVPDHLADGEAVVVHVRDVRTGEIDVYRGTNHVKVLDRALAARLARASR